MRKVGSHLYDNVIDFVRNVGVEACRHHHRRCGGFAVVEVGVVGVWKGCGDPLEDLIGPLLLQPASVTPARD